MTVYQIGTMTMLHDMKTYMGKGKDIVLVSMYSRRSDMGDS